MPFNGSGVYTAPAADFPVVTQTVISSTHFNNTINDIATALSTCLTKDGQQVATANIPFGGFRATNVGITAIAGSVGTPAINVSDAATGLYRSAASELAVTVAGTQRARFDGTGLIVTGVGTFSGATSTTTLTASTSVVTPLVGPTTDVTLNLQVNGGNRWGVATSAGVAGAAAYTLFPLGDATQDLGSFATRIRTAFITAIDSGTTGSLSLKTNNGTTGIRVDHTASGVNFPVFQSGATGNPAIAYASGSDTNVSFRLGTQGTGNFNFDTNITGGQFTQLSVLHIASANRNITITGSNGGNPTLSTTAGSLAITPAVVVAGASLSVGTNPSGLSGVNIAYASFLGSRNSTNSADIQLITANTINSVADVCVIGAGSVGTLIAGRIVAGAPATSDIPSGRWALWRDSSGATTKLYYNNGGVIQSVALA